MMRYAQYNGADNAFIYFPGQPEGDCLAHPRGKAALQFGTLERQSAGLFFLSADLCGRDGGAARGGAGIPANPKELKGGSANDGVPSLSLISIFGLLSVNPSSVAAMPAICLLPYIAIGDRGEARTVTTHCSRTMRSLRRHMGGMVIVVVSATAFFGRTCKHCCRGQHGYHD